MAQPSGLSLGKLAVKQQPPGGREQQRGGEHGLQPGRVGGQAGEGEPGVTDVLELLDPVLDPYAC